MKYHLVKINIAQGKNAVESKTMKGFVDRLDEVKGYCKVYQVLS